MRRTLFGLMAAMVTSATSAQETQTARADFINADGKSIGVGELSAAVAGGVLIKLDLTNLPESSWVAFHVHETGKCDHETDHKSAGGHFNPGSTDHGYMAANGPHAGDMPNQYVSSEGALRAEVLNRAVTLAEGEAGIKGRALMIHAKPDDYRSQPSGEAGDRLACAIIE